MCGAARSSPLLVSQFRTLLVGVRLRISDHRMLAAQPLYGVGIVLQAFAPEYPAINIVCRHYNGL